MEQEELIPHLFRTEYRKMVSVMARLFGIEHIEVAEDIVSDTFLLASELWGLKGLPENPTAWLYAVAKNKTKDHLKRNAVFQSSVAKKIIWSSEQFEEIEIDLSVKNVNDSQLAMMFVICHPCNPPESQIALALNLLCGFGVDEISSAFLTNNKTVYKRLQRAKQKLKLAGIEIRQPSLSEIEERLFAVSMTLYLLFNEGYYSNSQNSSLRKDLCIEAIRLTQLLLENELLNKPFINALMALMCFQSSRFDARVDQKGESILYQDQDTGRWDQDLIVKGEYYLNLASQGTDISKYHLEAGIAYWHCTGTDSGEKWENILQLYNHLLVLEYSPVAALNRTYALAKANGKEEAIKEAEKIGLTDSYLYHALLGDLYSDIDDQKALEHFQAAFKLVKSGSDQIILKKRMQFLASRLPALIVRKRPGN